MKTLTDITSYTDYVEKLNALFASDEIDDVEAEEVNYPAYVKKDFLKDVYMDEANYDILTGLVLNKKNVILQGYTSSGKTYLACALGKEACRQHYRTRYIRIPDLFEEVHDKVAEDNGRNKLLRKYANYDVLILDEWLMTDLNKADVSFLFELSERRFDKHSTIFCTLYKKEEWVPRLGRGTFAESIYERYAAHDSIVVDTGDMNMRAIFKNGEKREKE